MSFRKRHPVLTKLTLALLDGACFSAAYLFTTAVTMPPGAPLLNQAAADIPALVAALGVWYVVAFRQRLFLTRRGELLVPQLFMTTRVLFTWLILSVFLTAMLSPQRVDRAQLLVFTSTSIVLVLLGRALLRFSVWDLRRRGYNTHRILIVGANQCTEHLVNTIRSNEQFGWHIEGFLDDDPSTLAFLERQGIPYLGRVAELDRLLVQRVIDGVFINLPLRTSYNTVQNIINLCEGVGVPVRMVADLFPLRIGWTDVRRISGIPVISLVSRPSTRLRTALKRASEWLTASALLLLLAPALLAIAAAIRLTSGRPVLVKQARLGLDRRTFEMLAFRTTRAGAQTAFSGLTRIGRFLRRYGIDEIPQLINVWRGEMVLFGARPLPAAQGHPCLGCPRCWPEREPGVVRLWEQAGQNIAEAAAVVQQDPAAAPIPAQMAQNAADDSEAAVVDPFYEGSD